MTIYIVTWNLNKERSNYDAARNAFLQQLERYDNTKDAGLESVRWISTTVTADKILEDVRSKLDKDDRIFISQIVKGTYQGWLSQKVWDWINARI